VRRKTKRNKKRLMIGEKIIGLGFFTVLFMGSALDGPEWKIPLIGVIVGTVLLEVGRIVAKTEGSENV
jgi:hypothetical protein